MAKTTNPESLVYDTAGLAIVLDIGRDKAYALMQSKAFPSTRLGKKYIVSRASLETWLAKYAGREFLL